ALITLTRHAFVSCVPAPGSVASIVRWLTLAPGERPEKPQLYGIQTIVTSLPSTWRGFIRGVTSALTVSSPRAEEIVTSSPLFTPSFCPSDGGISTTGSGMSSFNHGMLRVDEPPHQCSATVDVIST